jgi:hypothetical protein
MNYLVIEARYLGGHKVWLRFRDGSEGTADLSGRLYGPVFEPLKDPAYFERFHVDDTLCWPDGADFAPETLYEIATGRRASAFEAKPSAEATGDPSAAD